jgi:hypothetical protein
LAFPAPQAWSNRRIPIAKADIDRISVASAGFGVWVVLLL